MILINRRLAILDTASIKNNPDYSVDVVTLSIYMSVTSQSTVFLNGISVSELPTIGGTEL